MIPSVGPPDLVSLFGGGVGRGVYLFGFFVVVVLFCLFVFVVVCVCLFSRNGYLLM